LPEKKILALTDATVSADGFGSFAGYASLFGVKDSQGDIVVSGAYADTIPQFIERGFIAWSHDWADPVATIRDAKEDERGLYIVADFHSDAQSQMARTRTAERLARGKFMGLSIGYQTDDSEATADARFLKKLTLFETSLVTVPALAPAGVTSAKADAKYMGGSDAPAGSYESLSEDLATAFRAQRLPAGTGGWCYVLATWPAHFIAALMLDTNDETVYWDVPYVLNADGTVTLGMATEVEQVTQFVPAKGFGEPYDLHSAQIESDVRGFVTRTRAGAVLRAKEGRAISSARRTRMGTVATSLRDAAGEIDAMLEETMPPEKAAADGANAQRIAVLRLRTEFAQGSLRRARTLGVPA
jgi:HK97 family phage prohead protease